MSVGVLDKVNGAVELIENHTGGLVLGLQAVKVLGHQADVGGVVTQAIGLGPGGLLAQLQLVVGDAVSQEDQLPAPVGHGDLPLDGQPQILFIKGDALFQVQDPDTDVAHSGHGQFLPYVGWLYCITLTSKGQLFTS